MKKILILLVFSTIFTSCWKKKPDVDPTIPNRTVLVYMEADNNLYDYALTDIEEMEAGWNDNFDGRILVFLNPRSTTTPARLYQIRKNSSNKIDSEVVKEYGLNVDATIKDVLAEVIRDTRELSPSNSYGLILWSHGTGWLPAGMTYMKSAPVVNPSEKDGISYSFGNNFTTRHEMEIKDLASAIPAGLVFDFIAFDACYMGSIEVSYELRNNAKYIISSSSETPVYGFPYDKIVSDMMSREANVVGIATKNYNYYASQSGWVKTCSISVLDGDKLAAVASSLKEIVMEGEANLPATNTIQSFAVNSYLYQETFFDLSDFVNKTWATSRGLTKFNNAMELAVVYKANTNYLLDQVHVRTFCGTSAHIPQSKYPIALTAFKNNYSWSRDSGLGTIAF